jgi:hypothetical protein
VSEASNRPSELLFYARETSWREALGLLYWRPLVCRLRGHEWKEHEWYEEDVPFTPSEHWRDCRRCERYEDLLGV